ncbi:hypothetical protein [Aureibacter tunicatorum]|uniref:Uncharacterized protein n=1 Tax=Aureibacter tunicatorum TaxID=866807 RepID=A0AAE3XQ00_9BACT|nr:hypothetical protein [Aureibacter tunicatorum]MDR6241007.1 hypothetical protein [Aureibacter tunicatorum]BDD03785.1 hypothetical protein AUTU_12680 [Aureibacter tunicatorum]
MQYAVLKSFEKTKPFSKNNGIGISKLPIQRATKTKPSKQTEEFEEDFWPKTAKETTWTPTLPSVDFDTDEEFDEFSEDLLKQKTSKSKSFKDIVTSRVSAKLKITEADPHQETLRTELGKSMKDLLMVKSDAKMDFVAVCDRVDRGVGIADTASSIVEKAGKYVGKFLSGNDSKIAGKVEELSGVVGTCLGAISPFLEILRKIYRFGKHLMASEKDQYSKKEHASEGFSFFENCIKAARSILSATVEVMSLVSQVPGPVKDLVPGIGTLLSIIDIARKVLSLRKNVGRFIKMKKQKSWLLEDSHSAGILSTIFTEENGTDEDELDRKLSDTKTLPDQEAKVYKEFALVRELKKVNRKRIVRETFQIGLRINGIIADVLRYGGVSAAASIGMSAGGTALSIGSAAVRKVKQSIRNKGYGDSRKTSTAKKEKRVQMSKYIFHMIMGLSSEDQDEADRISDYIRACGISVKEFVRAKTTEDRFKLLVSSIEVRG